MLGIAYKPPILSVIVLSVAAPPNTLASVFPNFLSSHSCKYKAKAGVSKYQTSLSGVNASNKFYSQKVLLLFVGQIH
jgi:hypothetical protein